MKRVKPPRQVERFLSAHDQVANIVPPPRILRPRREPPVRRQPAPVRALRQAYRILALRGQKLSVRRRQGMARKGVPRHGVGDARLGKAWPAVSFWPTNPERRMQSFPAAVIAALLLMQTAAQADWH